MQLPTLLFLSEEIMHAKTSVLVVVMRCSLLNFNINIEFVRSGWSLVGREAKQARFGLGQ